MTDGDALIHRHLTGQLSEEEARAVAGRVKSDPEFRRRLAEMAFDEVQLKEILAHAETEAMPFASAPREDAPAPARGSRATLAAAAVILVAVGIALVASLFKKEPSSAPLELLSGKVRVEGAEGPVRPGERIETLTPAALRFGEGRKVEAAAGSTLLFQPRAPEAPKSVVLFKGKAKFDLSGQPDFQVITPTGTVDHVTGLPARFLVETLRSGGSREAFRIVVFAGNVRVGETSFEAGRRAIFPRAADEDGDFDEESFGAFRGLLTGIVESRGDTHLNLRVVEISPRDREDLLVGEVVRVVPGEVRGEGEPQDDPTHRAYIRTLPRKERVTLEVAWRADKTFRIAALTPEQVNAAERGIKRERPDAPKPEREKDTERKPRREGGEERDPK